MQVLVEEDTPNLAGIVTNKIQQSFILFIPIPE